MVAAIEGKGISFRARDVSRQRLVDVEDVSPEATVGEVVRGLVNKMSLPENDVEGRRLNYHLLLEREGRHLHASETVGDSLETDDEVVMQPHIIAGGR